jgi:hypothetical protein
MLSAVEALGMTTTELKEDVLLRPTEGLEQALAAEFPGHEREWTKTVSEALRNVEQAVRLHTNTAEGRDGLLSKADLTRPTLARQAAELRREHTDLLNQAQVLQRQLQTAGAVFTSKSNSSANPLPEPAHPEAVPDFGAIRKSTEELLAALQHHKDGEARLLLESVNTDIGVGD